MIAFVKFNRFFLVYWFLYFSIVVGLFVSFELMRGYESQAERMVLTRFIGSKYYGETLGNNLLLFVQNKDTEILSGLNVPILLEKLGTIANHSLLSDYYFNKQFVEVYTSQFGLMGNIASFIGSSLNLELWKLYLILKVIALLLQTSIITAFVATIYRFFGRTSAFCVAVIFLTPWPLIFSSNFFYLIQINLLFFLIPILISRWLIHKNKVQITIVVTLLILTFIYSLMGYMFVTVWISNILLASLLENSRGTNTISMYFTLQRIFAIVVGFLLAVVLHLHRVSGFDIQEKGQTWRNYILQNKLGFVDSPIIESRYREFIFIGPFENLFDYLRMPMLTPWVQSKINGHMPVLSIGIFLLLLCSVIGIRMFINENYSYFIKVYGLDLILITLLGVLSWLHLLRPQSADNIHLNTIIFFLPMIQILIAIAFISYSRISSFIPKQIGYSNVYIYIGLILLFHFISLALLLQAKKSGY